MIQNLMADRDRDESSEEEPLEDEPCSFLPEDRFVVQSVTECLRIVLRRPEVTLLEIVQLGHFLLALGRLPRVTKDFGMSVALKTRLNEEMSWHEAQLDADSFQLNSGGSVNDPQVGHDSYANIDFEAGIGWRDSNDMRVLGWLETFRGVADDESWTLSIDDQGELPDLTADERAEPDERIDYWTLLETEEPDDE